jgi:hypothetical protein
MKFASWLGLFLFSFNFTAFEERFHIKQLQVHRIHTKFATKPKVEGKCGDFFFNFFLKSNDFFPPKTQRIYNGIFPIQFIFFVFVWNLAERNMAVHSLHLDGMVFFFFHFLLLILEFIHFFLLQNRIKYDANVKSGSDHVHRIYSTLFFGPKFVYK